jgi:hypothetical protein
MNRVGGSFGLNVDDDEDYSCYARPRAIVSPDVDEQPSARATTPALSHVPRRLRSGIKALEARGEQHKVAMEAALLRAHEAEAALEKYKFQAMHPNNTKNQDNPLNSVAPNRTLRTLIT